MHPDVALGLLRPDHARPPHASQRHHRVLALARRALHVLGAMSGADAEDGATRLTTSIIEDSSVSEKLKKSLKLVRSSGTRLGALVNDIKDTVDERMGNLVRL